MHFPYLRGEHAELSALESLSSICNEVIPVIEPTASNLPELERCVHEAVERMVRMAIVISPPTTAGRDALDTETLLRTFWEWQSLTHVELFWPAIVIDESQSWRDTLRQVERALGPEQSFRSIHRRPNLDYFQAVAGRGSLYHRARFHMADPHRTDFAFEPVGHSPHTAIARDPFTISSYGADCLYSDEPSFSDVPARYAAIGALDFADFTSTLDVPAESDLANQPITIPWTSPYSDTTTSENDVLVRIFAADPSSREHRAEQQFAEAGAKFLAWWENDEIRSDTSYDLVDHITAGRFPGHQELKTLCIRNHLETISSISLAGSFADLAQETAAWREGRPPQGW